MTASTDLLSRPATELLDLLGRGELSAVELVDASLDRLAGVGAAVHAVVDTDPERAQAAARRTDDRRAAGEPLGPLAGLPVTVKDAFDAAGLRTSHGRLLDARVADVDAPVVRRLRDAGAIVVGKTNVPVHLADYQSTNEDFGCTRNPHALDRSPGGSSGGAAAAVAAGLSVADLGSDLAGSLRVPASWCGLFGHRPSNGVVSKLGHMPWPQGGRLEPMISAVGPLTRSAADASLVLDALVGVEGPDARAWRIELPPARIRSLRGTRVAVWTEDPVALVDDETRSAIRRFADELADAGAHVEELAVPPVAGRDALDLFLRLQMGEVSHGLDGPAWQAALASATEPGAAPARGQTQRLRDALADLERQLAVTEAWDGVHDRVDVVLCPATPTAAPVLSDVPIGDRGLEVDGATVSYGEQVPAWSLLSSLGRGPATVIPLGPGAASGLPIGAQLLGAYLDDRTPLAFARLAEAAGLLRFHPPSL